jgi:hypothetical protein
MEPNRSYAMIERVDGTTYVLRPNTPAESARSRMNIKVSRQEDNPADYLYNPNLADKIHISRQSISEEIGLLKLQPYQKPTAKASDDANRNLDTKKAPATAYSAAETLNRSLNRLKSLLYQFASVTAADPDSFEAIQRKLADELLGFKRVFKNIKLQEFDVSIENLDDVEAVTKIDLQNSDAQSVQSARKVIEDAEDSVEKALGKLGESGRQDESRTEAALKTAEQNLEAAENTFYPEDILIRTRDVAAQVYSQIMPENSVHGKLQPDQVLALIGGGQ